MEVNTDQEHVVRSLRLQLLIERVVIAALALVFLTFWAHGQFANPKSLILVDGKPVVCVPSPRDADDVLRVIKSRTGCNPDEIKFMQDVRVARAPRDMNTVSRHMAVRMLGRMVSPVVLRWAIIVNGRPAVAVPNREAAGAVLDLAKLKYGKLVEHLAEEPQFKENVKVDIVAVDPSIYYKAPEQAVEELFAPSAPTQVDAVYVVRSGDVASSIAARNGIKLQDLDRMNSHMNLDRLQIGDKIRIKSAEAAKPKLTVVVRDQNEDTEHIPAPTENVGSDKLAQGQKEVISSGRDGLRKVRIATIYENGHRVGSEVVDEEILREPTPQRVRVGIKRP